MELPVSIRLTHFPRLTSAAGRRISTTWERLLARLAVPRVAATKESAAGLSLGTYVGDRRSLENVEAVYAVGLDLDKRLDWGVVTQLFDRVDSFTHTTWRSTPEQPRARVFLRLDRPVSGAEYRLVYGAVAALAEARGLVVDRQASDPSRFWFLPSHPPGGTYSYSVGRGRPVSVAWALAHAPRAVVPAVVPRAPSGPVGNLETRAAAYLARCEAAVSGSGGHNATFLVAQKMVLGFGLDDETAYRLLAEWNLRCSPPWSERELRRKVAQARQRGRMSEGALRDQPLRRAS